MIGKILTRKGYDPTPREYQIIATECEEVPKFFIDYLTMVNSQDYAGLLLKEKFEEHAASHKFSEDIRL